MRCIDEINRKATYLQKSHDVKKMQTFLPVIKKQETLSEVSQYSFPTFCEFKIDANYFQTYFGYVERVQEKEVLISDRKLREDEVSIKKILEVHVPTVTSDIYTGFTDSRECKPCFFDMAVTDDNKVWIGGNSRELKLFDLKGNVLHTVSITGLGAYFCMYNKHLVNSAVKAVKMVSDINTDVTMFSTNDWDPRGVTSTVSGDLLVCLSKDDLSKVVRYSSSGSMLQEIQYDSQPLYKAATYITENVNGDIIVTDVKKRAVIAVDRLGILQYSYLGNNETFLACSVAHDSLGHVIVIDYNDDKLHMPDREGQFLMYIIPEEEIEKRRGLGILDHGEMMVGECMSGIAKIIKYLNE